MKSEMELKEKLQEAAPKSISPHRESRKTKGPSCRGSIASLYSAALLKKSQEI